MKTIAIASVLAFAATSALAQSAPPKVPTGIDVKGHTYYYIPHGTNVVVQQAEACTVFDKLRGEVKCANSTGAGAPSPEPSKK